MIIILMKAKDILRAYFCSCEHNAKKGLWGNYTQFYFEVITPWQLLWYRHKHKHTRTLCLRWETATLRTKILECSWSYLVSDMSTEAAQTGVQPFFSLRQCLMFTQRVKGPDSSAEEENVFFYSQKVRKLHFSQVQGNNNSLDIEQAEGTCCGSGFPFASFIWRSWVIHEPQLSACQSKIRNLKV